MVSAETMRTTLNKTRNSLEITQQRECELRIELDVMENQFTHLRGEASLSADRPLAAVAGRTIVYIGGRPGATHAMRDLVEGANGEFIHHDGGVEDRRGLLVGAVNKADLVIFPVDCVSHDAAIGLKRLCQQAGKPFRPIRSASVSSFLAAVVADPVFTQQEWVEQSSAISNISSKFSSCDCHG